MGKKWEDIANELKLEYLSLIDAGFGIDAENVDAVLDEAVVFREELVKRFGAGDSYVLRFDEAVAAIRTAREEPAWKAWLGC